MCIMVYYDTVVVKFKNMAANFDWNNTRIHGMIVHAVL